LTSFRVTVIFDGVDLESDSVLEALSNDPELYWSSESDISSASAVVEADSALAAADSVIVRTLFLVPTARPLRLDEDLVSTPDIASRIGVTREAVRKWANGSRGDFPMPRGTVGGGIRVWRWAEVNEWLRRILGLGDAEAFPSDLELAEARLLFMHRSRPHSGLEWVIRENLPVSFSSPRTRVIIANVGLGQQTWVPASRDKEPESVQRLPAHAA
jgi:hypothetical protein